MEQSSIRGENSPKSMERASMSAADDVLATRTLFEELAARLAPKGDAARVLHRELREERDKELFSFNRVFELLKGKARRVDAWEKEYAERRLAALRRQDAINQIANLNRTLEYLRSSDPDGYRGHIDRLEHALSRAGILDRAVAAPDTDESTDFSD